MKPKEKKKIEVEEPSNICPSCGALMKCRNWIYSRSKSGKKLGPYKCYQCGWGVKKGKRC
jgi:predicted RNA-binding Zn-ribbon protein involved in translation (DUF1610 family)